MTTVEEWGAALTRTGKRLTQAVTLGDFCARDLAALDVTIVALRDSGEVVNGKLADALSVTRARVCARVRNEPGPQELVSALKEIYGN